MLLTFRMCVVALCPLMPVLTANVLSADPTLKELQAQLVQLEKRQTVTEKKLEGVDSKLDAILAAVSSKPKAVASAPASVAQPQIALGGQGDHTHTCSKGHTWGGLGHSHNCPQCGEFQNVQDTGFRQAQFGQLQQMGSPQFSIGSGGCANGQCSSPQFQQERRGLFGRRR